MRSRKTKQSLLSKELSRIYMHARHHTLQKGSLASYIFPIVKAMVIVVVGVALVAAVAAAVFNLL